jgi:hypothetical protein
MKRDDVELAKRFGDVRGYASRDESVGEAVESVFAQAVL